MLTVIISAIMVDGSRSNLLSKHLPTVAINVQIVYTLKIIPKFEQGIFLFHSSTTPLSSISHILQFNNNTKTQCFYNKEIFTVRHHLLLLRLQQHQWETVPDRSRPL